MKKVNLAVLLLAVLLAASLLAGCQNDGEQDDGILRVVLLITSQLGDRGFYDSAHNGMALLQRELGAEVRTIEMGQDPSRYDPYIRDVAEQNWDYIIIGTSPAIQIAEELIPQYPNKKFIMFDTEVDWTKGNFSNLYCITYKQHEGSFLAGVTAAILTTEGARANPQRIIGAIGGAEHPVISDFLLGYIEGARAFDRDIRVAIAYAGTFIDSTRGKELGLAMMSQQNVDVIFQVASQTGIGVIDAAREMNLYAIGVDGDQEAAFRDSSPQMADAVVTSMMKRVDQSILRAVRLAEAGELPWGTTESIGLNEQGVGIIYSGNFQRELSAESQQIVRDFEQRIINGEIKVTSAFDISDAEFQRIVAEVRP